MLASVKVFVLLVVALIQSTSADQDAELHAFRVQAINSIQQPFNNLMMDVYGHFARSQNTLRGARQDLFRAAENFPYYRLSSDKRKSLVELLDSLIYNVIDPTVDYVQRTSMQRFYAFNTDERTPVEEAFSAADSQLSAMSSECAKQSDVTARKLMNEYQSFISSINDCTKAMNQQYRSPIGEFTRVHFNALPLINKIGRELNNCAGSNEKKFEPCVTEFITKHCQNEGCQTNGVIILVKDQAEKMVKEARSDFDLCLNKAKDQLPTTPSFLKEGACAETVQKIDEIEEISVDANGVRRL